MPAIAAEPAVSGASHPVAIATRRRRSRIILIAGAFALLGAFLALSADTLAGNSSENARFFRAFGWVGAIACGLLWVPLVAFLYSKKASAADALANSPYVLARWRYTPDEQEAFVARERERIRMTAKSIKGLAIFFGGLGIVVCGIGAFFYGWQPATMAVTMLSALIFGAFVTLLSFISNKQTLASLPESFAGEVIIGNHGVLTATQISQWGTRDAILTNAEFVPGEPGELRIKIRRITHTQDGTSETIEDLRVPAPKGHDDEARNLVATLLNRG